MEWSTGKLSVGTGIHICAGLAVFVQVPYKDTRSSTGIHTWISQTCATLMYLDIGDAPRYLRRMKNLVDSFLS